MKSRSIDSEQMFPSMKGVSRCKVWKVIELLIIHSSICIKLPLVFLFIYWWITSLDSQRQEYLVPRYVVETMGVLSLGNVEIFCRFYVGCKLGTNLLYCRFVVAFLTCIYKFFVTSYIRSFWEHLFLNFIKERLQNTKDNVFKFSLQLHTHMSKSSHDQSYDHNFVDFTETCTQAQLTVTLLYFVVKFCQKYLKGTEDNTFNFLLSFCAHICDISKQVSWWITTKNTNMMR